MENYFDSKPSIVNESDIESFNLAIDFYISDHEQGVQQEKGTRTFR